MTIPHRLSLVALLAAIWSAAPLGADEVFLRNGGRLSGVIVEKTPDAVVIETGPGRVRLLLSRVERIVLGRSALVEYQERAAALDPADTAGWTALARWAAQRDLATQAQEAWRRVLRANPGDPEANTALGREAVDGRWIDRDQAYRERGYVFYEGRWLTPAEHDARLREQAAEDAARNDRRESEARGREAEARAREGEARAREAESAQRTAEPGEYGLPIWWGPATLLPLPADPEPPVVVIENPPPVPSTPPSSIGSSPSSGGSGTSHSAGVERPEHGTTKPAHAPPPRPPKSLN